MATRIIFGLLLTMLAAGVFAGDQLIGPPYPFLGVVVVAFGLLATRELLGMFSENLRPRWLLVAAGTMLLLAVHWTAKHKDISQWPLVTAGFTATVLVAFLVELRDYRSPGTSVIRLALGIFSVAYLGLLAGFFVALRLDQVNPNQGTLSLILAVFVPKGCDIGAYFTGSFIGRHKMAAVLSPKKTWEGAAGGLLTAMAVALAVQWYHPIIPGGWIGAAAFGLVVGAIGMLGDLAESMIKRDGGAKDAANLIPGFGGILDVIDAILFAAPVVYFWLHPNALFTTAGGTN